MLRVFKISIRNEEEIEAIKKRLGEPLPSFIKINTEKMQVLGDQNDKMFCWRKWYALRNWIYCVLRKKPIICPHCGTIIKGEIK